MSAARPATEKELPAFRLEIEAPANGKVGKATITVLDDVGGVVHTDKADLASAVEMEKALRRIARALQITDEEKQKKLLADLKTQWNNSISERRRLRQLAESGSPEAVPSPPCSPCSPGSVYEVRGNRIYLRRHSREAGDYMEPLANFTARIIGEDVIDDGSGEVRHVFQIEGTLHNGAALPASVVPCSEFSGMTWIPKAWGCRPNPAAGMGAKDHLRAAIQELSGDPPRRVIYQHTGWRMIGGKPHFLHAAGAIGAGGINAGVLVQLDGPLSRFLLPNPPEGEKLAEAVRASVALLTLKPARILFPGIGAVYRAPLGKSDSSIHVTGITGGGKSELAALFQQHYGAGMDRLNLPGNWSSTANSLEALAFLAKDALLVIDDFKPQGSKHDIDQWHSKADRVLRAQGNGSGRGRCRVDGTPRADKPPRGFIVSTGEDTPRGESLQARNIPLLVGKGDLCISGLTPYQRAAAQGLYAGSMAGYVRWLAADYEAIQDRLPEERSVVRDQALSEFTAAHARVPGAVADLFLGLRYFLDFAEQAGAIEPRERRDLEEAGWEAILEAARHQAASVASQDPAQRFIRLVAAAIASSRVHVAGTDGGMPSVTDNPESWGWRAQLIGTGDHTRIDWQPLGKQIGWIDGEDLYLEPEAAYAEVQRLADEQGERLPLSQRQLVRQLKDGGLLASYEQAKATRRVRLQGRERAVWHIPRGTLSAQKQGEQGEQGE